MTPAPTATGSNGSQSSSIKTLVITILTTLLITGGLAAAFGKYLVKLFVDNTTKYNCTILIRNGPYISLPNVNIHLHSITKPKDIIRDTTDDYGKAIIENYKGIYKLKFAYNNALHCETIHLKRDTVIIIDIGKSLVNPVTGAPLKVTSPQPSKSATQRTSKVSKAVKVITAQNINAITSIAPPQPVTVDTTAKPAAVKALSANEILESLQLRVRIDKQDSYKSRGKQFAYHYYLSGDKSYLAQIVQVLYQRNDPSFPEFEQQRFNVSDDRLSGFDYTGYQWGNVSTTYVQLVMKNGSKSDVFLKEIAYD